MKRIIWSTASLLVVVHVAFAAASYAQDRDVAPNRDEVEGMMDAYILSKLQDALELTDDQFGTMVVAQKKLQDTRRSYRQGRMTLLRQLRQTLRRDQRGEDELALLLDDAEFQLLLVLTDALAEEWESEDVNAFESTALDPAEWTAGERRRFVEKLTEELRSSSS